MLARGPTAGCVPVLRRNAQESNSRVGCVSSLTGQKEDRNICGRAIHVHDNYCKQRPLSVLADLIARTFVPTVCTKTVPKHHLSRPELICKTRHDASTYPLCFRHPGPFPRHTTPPLHQNFSQLPNSRRQERYGAAMVLLDVVVRTLVAEHVPRRERGRVLERPPTQPTFAVPEPVQPQATGMRWEHPWWRNRRSERGNGQGPCG